jgi:hypothetical protein
MQRNYYAKNLEFGVAKIAALWGFFKSQCSRLKASKGGAILAARYCHSSDFTRSGLIARRFSHSASQNLRQMCDN